MEILGPWAGVHKQTHPVVMGRAGAVWRFGMAVGSLRQAGEWGGVVLAGLGTSAPGLGRGAGASRSQAELIGRYHGGARLGAMRAARTSGAWQCGQRVAASARGKRAR
jgi:hypothetical protein